MSWQARAGRAGTLALLAVGWGSAAHLTAHDAGGAPPAGILAWAWVTSALLSWWLTPRSGGDRVPATTVRLLAALLAGQALTHTALGLAPLLLGSHEHRMHAGDWWSALVMGGPPMLLAHLLASVAVAVSWAASLALVAAARRWWSRLRPHLLRAPLLARVPVTLVGRAIPSQLVLGLARPRGPPVHLLG